MVAYGAEIVLTPAAEGMAVAAKRAEKLTREVPASPTAGPYENPANAAARERPAGPEFRRDPDGTADVFAACVGTGGTVLARGAV